MYKLEYKDRILKKRAKGKDHKGNDLDKLINIE